MPPPPRPTLFPYTTLFRSVPDLPHDVLPLEPRRPDRDTAQLDAAVPRPDVDVRAELRRCLDRKSTRLNSSHGYTSYAVFCLKKKTAPAPPSPSPARRPSTG